MDLLDMQSANWYSSTSDSTNLRSLKPSAETEYSTPPVTNTEYVTEQVHKILFDQEEDCSIKWRFLTTKAPFPVSKLLENTSTVELLLTKEPGSKVDYKGLGNILALLKPYVINTPSGSALLGFFKSLLQLQATWLLAAAKLEAFRSYDKTTFAYYIEWSEAFRQNTTAGELDEKDLAYQEECQEHAHTRASGFFEIQEQQLVGHVQVEEMKLVHLKTSQEMWKNSRILWAIAEQYQSYRQTKKAADKQEKHQEEEIRRTTEEMIERRAEVKKKNEEIRKRQMGMQQQDANNLFIQQDWMSNYVPVP